MNHACWLAAKRNRTVCKPCLTSRGKKDIIFIASVLTLTMSPVKVRAVFNCVLLNSKLKHYYELLKGTQEMQ